MGNLEALTFFVVTTWSFGFTLTSFFKNADNFWERNIMRLGIGLAAWIPVGMIFVLFGIPLHWWLFLIISIIYPIIHLALKRQKAFNQFDLRLTKANIYAIIALFLFTLTLQMHVTGAFSYPYLEDDDSWSHAIAVKYVAEERSVLDTPDFNFQYMDPYPPGYDMWLGVTHQLSSSLQWTLKFFNALFISLAGLFFYFFARRLTGNTDRALMATVALVAVPAFLSHFIWAIALLVPLMFVAFYTLIMIKQDGRWIIPSAFAIAGALIVTPSHSTYFGLLAALWLATSTVAAIKDKGDVFIGILSQVREGLALFLGLFLSFIVWWLPSIVRYGVEGTKKGMGLGGTSVFSVAGTGDRAYTLADFVVARGQNMINAPIGFGIVVSILVVIGILALFLRYKQFPGKYRWGIVALVWFLFALYAVNAANMPIKLSPFRAWVILAVPVALLAGEGAAFLGALGSSFLPKQRTIIKYAIFIILIAGMFFTSYEQKYQLNAEAQWPPGAFWQLVQVNGQVGSPELQGYQWMRENVPHDSRVFSFWNAALPIGFEMNSCHWCAGTKEFRDTWIELNATDIHAWLRDNDYKYVIVSGQDVQMYGQGAADKANEMANSGLFGPTYQQPGGFLMLEVI